MRHNIIRAAIAVASIIASSSASGVNPFLPLWEYIPDGEPYVFDDPDNPGRQRVYIYGSHDSRRVEYCGLEQVVWSAPVDSLDHWRYDGIIFESKLDRDGNQLNAAGEGDLLYAPDVTMTVDADGHKTYWLYPNNQRGGREGMIAKSSRPDGPFTVTNWSTDNPRVAEGVLRFDPAVIVDDDGRVYGYWGFRQSFAAELDPTTMATVKPGTEIVANFIPSLDQDTIYRFFEASSMRKIKDKYVFIYSRWTRPGESGLYGSNYTLAYAYGDSPLGPLTYGGTIIDGRAIGRDAEGNIIPTAAPYGNTHGSIAEINGQWYVFYHRQTGLDEYTRQAMVAPISVTVEEGPGGRVTISEAEYTSEGFDVGGLDPLRRYSAGIASHHTGPSLPVHDYPYTRHTGSYMKPLYGTEERFERPYDLDQNHMPVVNNTSGSIIGYKYFNFSRIDPKQTPSLTLNLEPAGIDATITVMIDSPYANQGGKIVGTFKLTPTMKKQRVDISKKLPALRGLTGRHALYLVVDSPIKGESAFTLHQLQFTALLP